jgi:hypothetical protein
MARIHIPEGPIGLPDPEPKWKLYEKAIARIEESYANCKVTHDYKVIRRRSGVERQVDVWISAVIGHNHRVTVAIECRRYDETPVPIKDVDAFYGFLDDVAANKGVMVSHTGFTEGAEKRAQGSDIELKTLTLEEAQEFDWEEYVSHSCCSPAFCLGTINWQYPDEDGSSLGFCSQCGSLHIKCGNCGSVDFYDETGFVHCRYCEQRWELESEKGLTVGIRDIPPEEEPEEEDEGDE